MVKTASYFFSLAVPVSAFTVGSKCNPASALCLDLKLSSRMRRTCTGTDQLENVIDLEDKPKWAAGGILSDLVNVLIGFKPIFGLMKTGARKLLIENAEKNGVPWRERAIALEEKSSQILKSYYEEVERKGTVYPEYYTQEFHAYDEGNLNWMAAYECESATMSMALRIYPTEGLTAVQAQDKLRQSITDAITKYIGRPPEKLLDMGCSVGVSTFYLAKSFPSATVIDGIDLSPHFLAIAKQRQQLTTDAASGNFQGIEGTGYVLDDVSRFVGSRVSRIKWIHGNVEATQLPENEYDVVEATFLFHELPATPTDSIIKEMYRVTAVNGIVAITDNDPRSPVIKGLPPAIFTLMKSTVSTSITFFFPRTFFLHSYRLIDLSIV